ncbi:hypothetical protein JQ634_00030 [Bradyrhizobium sp. AUGA SZCCT0240]|uniref:hypothetical protein n=1 Tax=unclassified Bradyrhizobium TaxID=2631580 RepID=UPI001BA797C9|nr:MULTISPECIES: hypothetical protein [unclassified Bradyrhizobium]MBR1196057.1 hypothetical protein [Bradyrhizobium sp. AUGA SZCCT0158]MBR1240894.1 hypothetical protein [Bradyrhizobium sp. AUGA SZCCT0274]MBR1252083.1 hypothetical protein [Bradyrhizobium sp. AUGA SZCCT0240]
MRFGVLHLCGIGRSTEGDQKAQGQNSAHYIRSRQNRIARGNAQAAPPQSAAASRFCGVCAARYTRSTHRVECDVRHSGTAIRMGIDAVVDKVTK